jgi:hypothetical protein
LYLGLVEFLQLLAREDETLLAPGDPVDGFRRKKEKLDDLDREWGDYVDGFRRKGSVSRPSPLRRSAAWLPSP